MLNWIKLRADSFIHEGHGKKFIFSGKENTVNTKIVPLPCDENVSRLLSEVKNEFIEFNVLKRKFSNDPRQAALFKHLCLNLMFVYKTEKDSPYTFCPKISSDVLVNCDLPVEKSKNRSTHAFLKQEARHWIIDAPSAAFYVKLDREDVSSSKIPNEFLKCFDLTIFENPNEVVDFKDQLFFHETRRRSDRPKGTSPREVVVSKDRLKALLSKTEVDLNLNHVPNIFRRNSSRGAGRLTFKELRSLLENVFAKQASLDDAFLGKVNKRFYPSAGAGYELSPVVFVKDVEGISPGAYFLDSDESSLVKLDLSEKQLKKVYESTKRSWGSSYGYPPAVIQLIVNPNFYYQKYSQICLSLSFLNAGVIFSEVYRAAHLLNIGACGLGSIAEDIWFSVTDGEFVGIAEIAITGLKKSDR